MASVQAVQHKERVNKAVNSLEPYGLKRPEIVSTLTDLLKVYNNEWEFIEAENYRTLIDSIFEAQEDKKTSRGGRGGRRVTRGSRARLGSDEPDDSDYSPPPEREASQPPETPPSNPRCNGRSDALVPAKRTESPVCGRGGDSLPDNVAQAVNYHSGASVRTRAATLSLQGGGGGSPGARGGRVVVHNSAAAAAAAAHEKEKGKSPLVPQSRRALPPPSRGVNAGNSNLITVKLEVSDSLPAPEGFEKVSFEKVDGVIKVRTPNRAGASTGASPSQKPARQPTPAVPTRVNNTAVEVPIQQSDSGNQVFFPAPLLAKDPASNVTVVCVKKEPLQANAGPPDHADVNLDQSVQCELSLDDIVQLSPAHLQIVPHGTVFVEDPPAEKPLNINPGPSTDQAPQVELEKQDGTVLVPDNRDDRDGNVLSLVDYDDDLEPPEQGAGSDLLPIPGESSEQVEQPELHGANIRPNFIVSGSKRDNVDAQTAFDPKRQKCEVSTHLEFDMDGASNKSAPSSAPFRRRLVLLQSPSPERRVNGDRECTPSEGPSIAGGVKRKLIIPGPERTNSASKETSISNGDHTMVRTGDTPKGLAAGCEERRRGTALEVRGEGNRSLALKRVKLATVVEDPNGQKLKHDPADISRGTERIPIPFVNEFTSETIDHKFSYIPSNVVYQSGYVDISLARIGDEDCCVDCVGDCLNAPHSCACTRETGGVFAYTQDGLLRPELIEYELEHNEEKVYCVSGWYCPIERAKAEYDQPDKCKGHLVRKFVKECWHKCGCSMLCGNRVVQRGISGRLQVFFTNEGKGWGLRTVEHLPAGSFVCEYVGEIMTNMELDQRNQEVKKMDASGQSGTHKDTYPVLLDGDWCSESGLKDEEALCLDATRYGNVARFINHRCMDANLIDIPVSIEGLDRHYYHVAFFTSRDVQAGEELTWDYKIDFEDDEHPIDAFLCLCKSPYCRGARPNGAKKHKKGT
ncbi:unnamed protein product [Calypogeia fissa]